MEFTLLFPGQGSQQVGMGKFLFDNFTETKHQYEEASDAIKLDMKKLCFDSDDKTLALTENTQPAILLTSVATYTILNKHFGVKGNSTAGHSIGEYSSCVSANVISLTDAIKAVRVRGMAMQSAVPIGKGGMLAVMGLDNTQIEFLCKYVVEESGFSPLSPANFNSPGQVVISGSMDAINWLKENFKPEVLPGEPKRAKLIPLNVSAPFHCEMMKPAEIKMKDVLNSIQFKDADFPIIQNVNAKAEKKGTSIRDNLIKQISAPVLWTQCVQELVSLGFHKGIECGAGKVINGLVKKTAGETFQVFNTQSMDDLKLIEDHLKASSH